MPRGKHAYHAYVYPTGRLERWEAQTYSLLASSRIFSASVMSDMYAWNDLCGSREIGVKSQAMCTAAGFFPLLPRMGALVLVTDGGATCGEWTRKGRPSLKNWRAPTQLENAILGRPYNMAEINPDGDWIAIILACSKGCAHCSVR